MNIQYDRDVDITHIISSITVRTAPFYTPDFLDSSEFDESTPQYMNMLRLLQSFRNHWNTICNPRSDPGCTEPDRDMVQLFSGKEAHGMGAGGGVVGLAWVNVACDTDYLYSVVRNYNGVRGETNFGVATSLTSHELGHNWGAGHCSGTECEDQFTMNGFPNGANLFGPDSKPAITGRRDSSFCQC